MSNWTLINFARDLAILNRLISKYDLPIDKSSLEGLDAKLQSSSSLNFSVQDIEFCVYESMAGTIPIGISMYSIYFSHTCCIDETKDYLKYDPFVNHTGYSFQINMVGFKDGGDSYHSWLHLDRHIQGGGPTKMCHPFYHFQFGGNEMESKETGELMLMASPRIAHPPMDLFLGIHFVLDNYFNKTSHPKIVDLMHDDDYRTIMMNAQKRLWIPYFNAFSNPVSHNDYTIQNVFPLFLHD